MTETNDHDQRHVLAQSVREIRRLRAELESAGRAGTEPIAIVGMSCRMPGGAEDPEAFWEFLKRGGDGIDDVPASRWDADRYHDPTGEAPGTSYTRRGGFLGDIDGFDAPFFGISRREAESLDPQQRLVLEVGWEALEHAGLPADRLNGSRTGVFLGITNYDYCQVQIQQVAPADLEAYYATSNASTFGAGRLSYWLGLTGPSLSVDTSCSSSLVGVHLACQSLRAGDCTTALAGGVNVLLSPESFVVLSKTRALSPDGACKTFDKAANGYSRGEGCGIVVLKRLSDALASGDRVLAVIRGSAVNQDGRSSGLTVPNPAAQQDVVRQALAAAGLPPSRVDYVEAHGTGTPLGDPIELRSLNAVLGDRDGRGPLLVGSVKTNVGHLEPAAGIAGLIKTVLALRHGEIPPHLHLSEINPEIGIEDLDVAIPTEPTPWPEHDEPRIAGVSSFGASGTNAHVLLEHEPDTSEAPAAGADRTVHLLPLSAKSPAALTALATRYLERLDGAPDAELPDICFTAATGRSHFPQRLAVTGTTPAQLRERIAEALAADGATPPPGVSTGRTRTGARPKAVFLFTGQGAQYPAMARGLYATEPAFRTLIDACDEVLRPLLGRPLTEILDPAPGDEELINETRYTQPALFAVEYALAELWRSWGVEPAAVLGHSVGELVALCVAGVMTLEDGLRLAARRGRLMHDLAEPGAMAAVFASEERVAEALSGFAGRVSIGAVNGPESVVVSGAQDAVEELLAALAQEGVRAKPVATTRAFHSPLMEPMLDAFEQEAAGVAFAAPRIPVISNVTGEPLTGPGAVTARYLREHAREPVRFHAGMTALYEQGHRTFLEMGPAPTLLGMAKRFAPGAGAGTEDAPAVRFLPSLRRGHDNWAVLLESLGGLYAEGFAIDWARFDAGRGRRRADLPFYPFQRERYWFRPSALPPAPTPAALPVASDGGLLGHRIPSPLDVIQYASRLDPELHRCLGDCVMDGLPVVNVGVYLESVFTAARQLRGHGALVAEGLLVLQSLVLDPDAPSEVQLVLEPDGGEGAGFSYFAAHPQAGEDEKWVLHSRGTVRRDLGLTAGRTGTAHQEDTRRRLGNEMSGRDFYQRLWRRKLYLGPAAQWMDRVWSAGGEAVARMRLPEPGESEPYLLHPGLTDAMFQSLFACLPADSPPDAVYALVGIDRFVFHEQTGPGPLYCHATLSPASDPSSTLIADVHVTDADGRSVVEASGVYAKRAVRSTVLRESAGTERETLPVAAPAPLTSAGAAPAPAISAEPSGLAEIARAGAAERPAAMRELLLRTVARALRTDAAVLDPHEPLQNLGLDSLMALEVKDALSVELGIALPMVSFLDGSSITGLGEEILPMLDLAAPDPGAGEQSAEVAVATPVPRDEALPVIAHDAAGRHEPFGLTDLQQAYLVGRSDALALGRISTYFYLEVDLVDVSLRRVAEAWNTMVARHDMLRAVVTPDGLQRVLPDVPAYEIRTTDLRGRGEDERSGHLDAVHEEMKHQVLDAAVWPMFDIRATLLDDRTTRLHLGMDALVMDAWSTGVVFAEWARAYHGQAEQLAELPVTFRDYVLASRELEETPRFRRALDYWRDRIETLPPAPDLPLAKNPASLARPEFTHRAGRLDAAAWTRFKDRAAAAGVTPSAAVCTAYSQVLAAWSKSSRFTLNVLFFNRLPLHPDVANIVGNFTATTLLEVDSTATDGFGVRADRLQKQLWSDLENSHVSGVRVLRELSRARGNSAPAPMPVVFASTVNFGAKENPGAATSLSHPIISMGESGEEKWSSVRTPQVWLDHQVLEDGGGLTVNWDSVDELFPPGMIDAMFTAYLGVLNELCEDENAWRRPSPVLTPEADLRVREAANATAAPVPGGLLHDGFLARAAQRPDRPAVIAPGRTLSYGELDSLSNRLDRWLRERGAGSGTLVGIVMDKGWEQIAAAFGILKSGAAYVPIDAGVPGERLRLLLANAGISLVLTQSWVEERTAWPEGTAVLGVDGRDADAYGTEPSAPAGTAPDELAYVIYTSGSTGVPKGVMIEHGSAVNTIHDINERFGVCDADRVLALSALNFDLSVYDVFGLLAAGGAVVLPEPGAHREPARWAELVAEHRVTVWNSVPTLMEMFTEHALTHPAGTPGGADVPLKTVMMSGDWIPVNLPGRIRRIAPEAAVWSLGGATEASIWSILHPIGEVDPARPSIPYGTPMLNQRFHVLNDAFQPCPTWVPGQLYIAGTGLARGYLNDSAKTRASFVRHPATGERLYRTGDLGRCLPDGTIEFLGREDFQVKVQGYRIELGEIEAALLRLPDVRAAAVTAVGGRHEGKRLIGYAVPEDGRTVEAADLERALRQELPDYLVPQRILVLKELALSANGKVDRAALPAPDEGHAGATEAVAPRDETEERLAAIWGEFFEARPIGVTANFFDLGGDSLLAVRVMARIHDAFGCALPLSTLFGHPTIERLADALRDGDADTRRSALVPIRSEGTRPPLFFVHPVGGDVLCYAELASLLDDDQPFHGLQVPDTDGDVPLESVPALAAHYAEAVTEAAPEGPLRLGGWSMGGVIALEMARLLSDAGRDVELVAVIDLLEPPGPHDTSVDEASLLAWFARDLAGLSDLDWTPEAGLFRGDDEGRSPLEILHGAAVRATALPPDVGVDTLGGIVARFSANSRALVAHEPRPYDGRVVFLRAADGGASRKTAEQWLALCPDGSVIRDVPGDHYSAMRRPHLSTLAAELRTALREELPPAHT
ncbi:amino acid adenylation domain-containing protein [Streptomyces sp. NPDC048473]|uniref:hybrid non-ribosomal peptide synthetase/type I polyketide synthase n=1 Tax=unclassified Streptomyces TaxID=2593676 RepID=UPI00371F7B10